jgi:hypothetical protein
MVAQPQPRASPLPRRAALALAALALAAALAAPAPALARDMTGKGGVGTLLPVGEQRQALPAIALRYWRRHLALDFHVGFDWWKDGLRTDDVRTLRAGAGVSWLRFRSRAYCAGSPCVSRVESQLSVQLELLLVAEWFFSDHLGISAAVGPSALLTSSFAASAEQDAGLDALLGRNLTRGGAVLGLGGQYGGGIGLHYYF